MLKFRSLDDETQEIHTHESYDIPVYSSLEEFDEHLPPTVTVLSNEFGSKVYVVGTAHFRYARSFRHVIFHLLLIFFVKFQQRKSR